MKETRKQRKTRLVALGYWPLFVESREQFKQKGMTPRQAAEQALALIDKAIASNAKKLAPPSTITPRQTAEPAIDRTRLNSIGRPARHLQ